MPGRVLEQQELPTRPEQELLGPGQRELASWRKDFGLDPCSERTPVHVIKKGHRISEIDIKDIYI